MNGNIGSESAMRIIYESVAVLSGEPYTADELSAKADPDRYVWEHEQGDWQRGIVVADQREQARE